MFSHIITFGSSLPEALGGQSLYTIICERVLRSYEVLRRNGETLFSSTAPRLTKRGSPISMFLVFMSHWAVCERSHMTFGFREWLPVSQRSDLHLKSSWHSVPNGTDCQRLEYLLWFVRISFHSVVAHVGIMEVCNGCGGSRNCRNRPGEPCSTPDNSCSALPCISPRVVCRPPMNTPSIAIKMRFVDCLKD